VYEIVMERGLLTRAQLDRALDPERMAGRRTPMHSAIIPK
jgi:aspartate ammonia-lyase